MINALRWLVLGLALAGNPAVATAQTAGELLEPEKAFRIYARALDRRGVEIEFKIARGYYLYRKAARTRACAMRRSSSWSRSGCRAGGADD